MKDLMTDEQVEAEIDRLNASEDVQLARKEQRLKYKRRQYMYTLRHLERRGKELAKEGATLNNLETFLFGESIEEL
ncbi:MAG: hypothetical protein UDB15_07285 [Ruminococcus sp.]|nr:hypothetical protein [Ruminococcus sp.]DAU60463.1 MAG TPA: hypothetical protein [Caudoviricetes sp.]